MKEIMKLVKPLIKEDVAYSKKPKKTMEEQRMIYELVGQYGRSHVWD